MLFNYIFLSYTLYYTPMSSLTTLIAREIKNIKIHKNEVEFPKEIWDIIKSYLIQPLTSGDAFTISYHLFLQEHLNFLQYNFFISSINDDNILKKNISSFNTLDQARVNLAYTYAKNKWDSKCKNTYFDTKFIKVGHLVAAQYDNYKYLWKDDRASGHMQTINKVNLQGIITKVTKTYISLNPLPKSKYIKEYAENPNFTINIKHKIDVLWVCKNYINAITTYNFINEINAFKLLPKFIHFNKDITLGYNVIPLPPMFHHYMQNNNNKLALFLKILHSEVIENIDNSFAYKWDILDGDRTTTSKSSVYLPSKFIHCGINYTQHIENIIREFNIPLGIRITMQDLNLITNNGIFMF